MEIGDFKEWDKVVDYASDQDEVVLKGKNNKVLGRFVFYQFTQSHFDYFKWREEKREGNVTKG